VARAGCARECAAYHAPLPRGSSGQARYVCMCKCMCMWTGCLRLGVGMYMCVRTWCTHAHHPIVLHACPQMRPRRQSCLARAGAWTARAARRLLVKRRVAQVRVRVQGATRCQPSLGTPQQHQRAGAPGVIHRCRAPPPQRATCTTWTRPHCCLWRRWASFHRFWQRAMCAVVACLLPYGRRRLVFGNASHRSLRT
jgi:hypothetical protein